MNIIRLRTRNVVWNLRRRRRTAGTAPGAAATPSTEGSGRVSPVGPEDDPARWPPDAVRRDWTALDERQLIRLLSGPTS
jgi:hypothetical protein